MAVVVTVAVAVAVVVVGAVAVVGAVKMAANAVSNVVVKAVAEAPTTGFVERLRGNGRGTHAEEGRYATWSSPLQPGRGARGCSQGGRGSGVGGLGGWGWDVLICCLPSSFDH